VDRIVVLEGDQTGQELLEEALRVLAPGVIGIELEFPRFDLSLENRRATQNAVVYDAAAAIREHGFGLKAATITPEGVDDIGSVTAKARTRLRSGPSASSAGSATRWPSSRFARPGEWTRRCSADRSTR
jgi:isocitrate dehydrogenase